MYKASLEQPFKDEISAISQDASRSLMIRALRSKGWTRGNVIADHEIIKKTGSCYEEVQNWNRYKNTSNCKHGVEYLCAGTIPTCILGENDECGHHDYQLCPHNMNCCDNKCTVSNMLLCKPNKRLFVKNYLPFRIGNEILYDRSDVDY